MLASPPAALRANRTFHSVQYSGLPVKAQTKAIGLNCVLQLLR